MLANGTLIDDRFEIQSTIGVGGFGAVYKVKQLQFGRIVALKMLATSVLQQDDGAVRFEREAQAINALKHKNIISFYGYGVWNQAPYMVMECVDGIPLQAEVAQTGKIDPRRALLLIRQVFEALGSAHAAGIIHRDLKPSNIMLTDSGSSKIELVKIIDFGLAKLMPGYGIPGQKLTETGYALGSCHYMPPEQALGIAVDQRADIYSAGCVLYFMLTGRVLFDGDNSIAVMMQHLNVTPEPVVDALQGHPLSRSLSSFVDNCLAKQPDDRYSDCNQALAQIDAMLRGEMALVQPLVVRAKPEKRLPAHLIPITAIGGLLLLGACVVATSTQPKLTAKEFLLLHPSAGRIAFRADESLAVYERLYGMNLVDHSLSDRDYTAVLVGMVAKSVEDGKPLSKPVASACTEELVKLSRARGLGDMNLLCIGHALTSLGASAESVEVFHRTRGPTGGALEVSPLHMILAERVRKGRWDAVIREVDSDADSYSLQWLSVAYLMSGDLLQAQVTIEKSLDHPPREVVNGSLLQLARVRLARNDPDGALKISNMVEFDPLSVDLNLLLLRIAAKAGANQARSAKQDVVMLGNSGMTMSPSRQLTFYDVDLACRYLDHCSDESLRKLLPTLNKLKHSRV